MRERQAFPGPSGPGPRADERGDDGRGERRAQSESRILQAARDLFAQEGYERTTIRAVAGRADVDPALVMHYFGCKEHLFATACHVDVEEIVAGPDGELVERILHRVGEKLRAEPPAEQGLLRSMLTHDQAAESVRGAIASAFGQVLRDAIGGEEASLRTGLVIATTIGVLVGRYLLELDGLRDASPEAITDLLRPCFRALVGQGSGDRAEAT